MKISTIRKKIKEGDCLNDSEQMCIFNSPDYKELLQSYFKEHMLCSNALVKLVVMNDRQTFAAYTEKQDLCKDIIDYVLKKNPSWLYSYLCREDPFYEETEVLLVNTGDKKLISKYIGFRRLKPESELALLRSDLLECKTEYLEKWHELHNKTRQEVFSLENCRLMLKTDEGRQFFRVYLENFIVDGPIQIMLAEADESELFGIVAKNNLICVEAQEIVLRKSKFEMIRAFIQYRQFILPLEVEFIKYGAENSVEFFIKEENLLQLYLKRYKLSEKAEIELIKICTKNKSSDLMMLYLEDHCFSDHAWQYYIVSTR